MILETQDLRKRFVARGQTLHVVNGVSLALERGRTFGLVGESGSGKSTLAKSIVRLYRPDGGSIRFDGMEVTQLPERRLKEFRRRVQYVFQHPYSSLNPAMRIHGNLARGLFVHGVARNRAEGAARARRLLADVQMSPDHLDRYPHEFSGGQRQRIAIARALALEPELIVLDEPTSSLDVSVQSQILNLLRKLQVERNHSFLFITHDLQVARYMSHWLGVMYGGVLVETGPAGPVFESPRHPYTQALLSAVPGRHPRDRGNRVWLRGSPPDPAIAHPGCVFAPRCPAAEAQCRIEAPPLRAASGHRRVRCHFPDIDIRSLSPGNEHRHKEPTG